MVFVSREERAAAAEALGVREAKLAANMEELEQRSHQVMQQTAALAADRLALQASIPHMLPSDFKLSLLTVHSPLYQLCRQTPRPSAIVSWRSARSSCKPRAEHW